MARYKRKARRSYFKATRRAVTRVGMSPNSVILPAIGYGVARRYISNVVQPLTSMIPLGSYADELVLGGLGYWVAKKNLFGMRKVGMAMLTVEAFSVGNQMGGTLMSPPSPSGSSLVSGY